MPVAKSAGGRTGGQPQDQPGCAFMGTIVHQGSGPGVVVATGPGTAFGQIAAGLAEKHSQTAFEVGPVALLALPVRGGGRADRVHLHHQRGAVPAADRRAAVLAGHRRGHRPGDDAGHRHGQPVRRLQGPGSEEGTGQAAGRDRGPGQHRDPVHRQDGHPHRGRDHLRAGTRTPAGSPAAGRCCSGWSATRRRSPQPGPVGGNALDQALWSAPGAAAGRQRPPRRACQRLGVLPFDHERQLASVLVQRPRRPAARDHQGRPRGGPGPVRGRPRGARPALEALFCRGRPGGGRGQPARPGARPSLTAERRARADAGGLPGLRRPARSRRRRRHRASSSGWASR